MPAILYGTKAYRRRVGNLPELKLVNMFVEESPAGEQGVVLLTRPGLLSSASVGAGPVRGIFWAEGVFSGDLFVLSGGTLYRDGVSLGTVTGTGPVSFAASASELLITAGASLYSYDGTDFVEVSFPGGANVVAIAYHDGLFIAARAESQRYYWSAVNDGRTWDDLDFAAAESSPDNLVDLKILGDTLFLIGPATIEPWSNTGDPDAPYSRIEGRIIQKGAHGTGCTVLLDNSLFFVGSDCIVYRIADVPQRISDHGIEERIKASTDVSAFAVLWEGHSFFCIRLDDGTFAFDVATGQWCEFASYGRDNWRAQCASTLGAVTCLGDDEDGTVWTLSGVEDGEGTLEVRWTAAIPSEGPFRLDVLRIEANSGHTPVLTGQGADPVVEMRSSRDAGATWGDWSEASLGLQGNYRRLTEWRCLGLFDDPGAVLEFRCTDPVGLRVSKVYVPEKRGGRSR